MNSISIFYEHIAEAAVQSGLPLEEVCRQVKAFGYDLVEMDFKRLRENEEEILPLLQKHELRVNCIYNFFDFGVGENYPEADRAAAEEVVEQCVRANCNKLLVVAGFLTGDENVRGSEAYSARRARMAESIKQLVVLAAEKNITALMEDFDGCTAPFSTAEELLWFMENVPGLRCGFDTGNFLYSEEDALAVLPKLLPYVSGVHCKDRSLRENDGTPKETVKGRKMYPVAVGDGDLPMTAMMDAVLKAGYTGVFTAEHFDSKHQLRDMERSAVYMLNRIKAYAES